MYADHAATSHPVRFEPVPGFTNASAAHRLGRVAREALTAAQQSVAASLELPLTADPGRHVLVTSGGTEANNLVLCQPTWRFIVTLPTEHHAVLLAAQAVCASGQCELVTLSPDGTGGLDLTELREVLSERVGRGPGLVSLAYVNNEIGTVLDIAAIGRIVHAADNVFFHTDAVQAPGHVPIGMGKSGPLAHVDFLSLSAHKFQGPYGIGFLVSRRPVALDGTGPLLQPLMFGGHQQFGLRPGTEAVGAAVAAAKALAAAVAPENVAAVRSLHQRICAAVWSSLLPLVTEGAILPTGPGPAGRSPHILSFCVRGAHRRDLVANMERNGGVLVSGGSACNTDSGLPSHVLAAIGVPADYVHGSLRLSFGPENTMKETEEVLIPALRVTLNAASKS